jgi:hypothetical protein
MHLDIFTGFPEGISIAIAFAAQALRIAGIPSGGALIFLP